MDTYHLETKQRQMKIKKIDISSNSVYVFYYSDESYINLDTDWSNLIFECIVIRYGQINELMCKSYAFINIKKHDDNAENENM
jgi:hypothetical protein